MFNSIAILIPAYNPEANLRDLLLDLRRSGFDKIVIVDDGSDHPAMIDQYAIDSSAEIVRHEKNRGKGAALKTGFTYIAEKYPEEVKTIVTMDADGQHLCGDVVQVADCALKEPQNMILGVRDFDSTVPIRSAFGNILTKIVLRVLKNISLSDTQTGLRAIPIEFSGLACEIGSDRYEFELESILLADRCDITIQEQPIKTVYIDNNESSHFRPILDSMRIYAVFVRFAGVSLVSFIIDISIFAILYALTSQTYTSTYIARSISATLNFTGNKFFVFKSLSRLRALFEAGGYVILVVIVATLSAYFVDTIKGAAQMNVVAIKIFVDAFLFFVSFLAQRYLLFHGRL